MPFWFLALGREITFEWVECATTESYKLLHYLAARQALSSLLMPPLAPANRTSLDAHFTLLLTPAGMRYLDLHSNRPSPHFICIYTASSTWNTERDCEIDAIQVLTKSSAERSVYFSHFNYAAMSTFEYIDPSRAFLVLLSALLSSRQME